MTSRRGFLLGLGAALAAPAIVRAEVLMPVRKLVVPRVFDNAARHDVLAKPWLPCDGSEISRLVYRELFEVLGETHGAGDGRTTFNLPHLPTFTERVPNDGRAFAVETIIITTGHRFDAALPPGATLQRMTGAR